MSASVIRSAPRMLLTAFRARSAVGAPIPFLEPGLDRLRQPGAQE
jgi:hypothetical protein